MLFAILQKYDFSSKSQLLRNDATLTTSCLRYCKSTIFQANHNSACRRIVGVTLFAILQKYDFSSKSQLKVVMDKCTTCCLRYCKSTIFQANHNPKRRDKSTARVVCDTAKVRFFKQITTKAAPFAKVYLLFAILQKYDFSSKSQLFFLTSCVNLGCLRYCKSTIFQASQPISMRAGKTYGCLRYCKSTIFQANHNALAYC